MYDELLEALRLCVKYGKAEDALANAQQAADAIKELSKPRWIPVTERLPEKECKVLAYYGFNRGDGHLGMMFMQVMDYYIDDPRPHFQHEGLNGLTVTHWMPLPKAPEPPKEEE